MFDSEGIHQAIYIVAEHKVVILSEERHQLLMTNSKRRNSDIFSRRFRCLTLDSSNSGLLLNSSRSRTREFSSSCVKMCGCGAENLPWETCGSVDAGGLGEPEVDLPSSSSSESMVNFSEIRERKFLRRAELDG
jgi:hypothetical protein